MNRRRLFVAILSVIAVTLAACGSSSKPSSTGGGGSSATTAPPGSTVPAVVSKVAGTGVTATTIKVGISLVDFTCISQFVDSVRENQQQVYQAYIDNINATGGINGRKIVPDFKTYCPLSSTSDLNVALCTSFADDDKVFAVIGNLTDAANDGSAETCLAKKHKTVVITFDLTQQIMDLSPPGMIIFPGATPERSDEVLFKLLKKQGTLTGKKVGVLAEATSEDAVKKVILPGLKALGVKTGTPAYLTVSGSDTTAAQAQLSSFIERWKSEDVNALYVTGEDVASQQFMEKVSQGMPGVTLMTDTGDVLTFGKEEHNKGIKPNPYDGMLIANGFTPHDYDQSANWKYCAAIYKKYTGKTAPDAETKVPGPSGKTLDTNGSINDACQTLSLFHDVASRVGQYLNAPNWVSTVNSYGPIANRGGGPYASLSKGKYDFEDTFQLQAFDGTIPPQGNWKSLTPYENIPN
jgi:ABC-type branched-subunit amino acid transport system substrate-binding protein